MSHSSMPGSSRFTSLADSGTHVSPRISSTTPSAYPNPEHIDAHGSVSTITAQSTRSYSTPSAQSNAQSDKLIPRDYLASQSQQTGSPTKGGLPTFPVPGSRVAVGLSGQSGTATRQQSLRSINQTFSTIDENDRSLGRALSPESVVSSASTETSYHSKTHFGPLKSRSLRDDMPRASSIDSAISSVSTSSQQRRDAGELIDASPQVVQQLIATAGSPETLIVHLLKEKNHTLSQNNQLWKLVEKQRALLLGLNKDLERVTKDRDRYKRQLKELAAHSVSQHERATTPSPSRKAPASHENAVQAPTGPMQNDRARDEESTVDSTPLGRDSPIDAPGPAIITIEAPPEQEYVRPALQTNTRGLAQPSFSLTEATPLADKPSKGFGLLRKGAPKPLNLVQSSTSNGATGRGEGSGDEEDSRGRRKTRAEDDRDREKSMIKEQEARSKSAKAKAQQPQSQSQTETSGQTVLLPPVMPVTLPSSPRPAQGFAPEPLTAPKPGFMDRLVPQALRSPGLPSSPRPMGQTQFSALPVSPRAPPPGPLSPRAPKQPIPAPILSSSPFVDPAVIQKQNAMARQAAQESHQPADRLQIYEPTVSNEVPPVYQGLVSPQYPNLLLPPNALPSVQIKVASSRLRPSRHSMLGLRTQEDSTVFSLSIYSRASRNELWRVEKIPAVLPQLEQQLRPRCKDLPRLPDRKLFAGHSPALLDARRQAIDAYFEDLLDVEMDEQSALLICRFLSTDVLDPASEPQKKPGLHQESLPQATSLSGRVVKTGYLTKRGKNFGGWKSRWFVLDSPELRYYETPGGAHLGTIRIQHAGIGKQRGEDSADAEDQYRHAFLIKEPKKKDLTAHVRHVLCAESDIDRDEWVAALLHYVDEAEEAQSPAVGPGQARPGTANSRENQVDTKSDSSTPSQTPTSSKFPEAVDLAAKSAISKPMNGAPIQDSTQWGNKGTPQPIQNQKRGLFNFGKSSNDNSQAARQAQQENASSKPRVLRHNGYVRAVFGLPIAEAVEYCSPFNVDAGIPAVVYRCIEYLRFRNAANEEGLFRLSGSNIVIRQLKERFNTEGDIDLVDDEEMYDVHAVASLFKTYLRELPMPILPRDLHIEFLKVLETCTQEEKVVAFNKLVNRLPTANFRLLRAISEYLLEVTENAAQNKMSVRNMGIVFSPTINVPTPVFNLFLTEFSAIFDSAPVENGQRDLTRGLVPPGLAPSDIRSPRHQMFSDIPTPAYNHAEFTRDQTPSHGKTGPANSGDFGFTPLNPSYENGQYVSRPQEPPRTQVVQPPVPQHLQPEGEEQYGSLNRMLVPPSASSDKRRNRESMMF